MRKAVAAVAVSLAAVFASTANADIYQQVNGPPGPGNFFWIPDTIGWYWTPATDVMLDGIQTQLATASNINNNFTFSTTLYTDRPSEGGTSLGSFNWNGITSVDGPWLGGSFGAPLSLTGGTTYFIGMEGWAQAVGSLGPNSGAGVNWVSPPLGPPAENLGAGSSYTGADFGSQLSPSGLGTTDQPVLRFISVTDPGRVPEPTTVAIWTLFVGIGAVVGLRRRRKAA